MSEIVLIDNDTYQYITEGIQGPSGPSGLQGDGILLLGTVALIGDLPGSGNTAGDAYMVGNNLYVWSGTAWADCGSLTGPQGEAGPGVPTGGLASQALIKTSDTDYETAWAYLDRDYVQLHNVDNTSDANKPISIATQAALDGKSATSHNHAGVYEPSTTCTSTAVSKIIVASEHCTITASGKTITLPASPIAGNVVTISVGDFTDTTIDGNGSNIQALAEDLTIDKAWATVSLRYVDASQGWRFI